MNKGWSNDKKYILTTSNNKKLLLRVSDKTAYDDKKTIFEKLKQAAALNLNTPHPVDFGLCDDEESVYLLLTWVEGDDALSVLPNMSSSQQYLLGNKVAEVLLKLHGLPVPEDIEPWGSWFRREEVQDRIDFYNDNVRSHEGDLLVKYLLDNQDLLNNRPIAFMHGDCNIGNVIVTPDFEIGLIDFCSDYGDPWWEFDQALGGTNRLRHL